MGTPDFAVPSLQILVEYGFNVVAVVTATDKLGGRGGKQLLESAVKKYAQSVGIPVLQPENLKDIGFVDTLKSYGADLQIVVAFRMLPEIVWNMPPLGTYNLHGSLLPKYRGAAPINWAIINGEKETGVTSFKLKHEIDTGDLAIQASLPIGKYDTASSVHDNLMHLGANVVLKTVLSIRDGTIKHHPQNDSDACPAPKIHPNDCKIDFNKSAEEVHNFIRGMAYFPGAFTTINGVNWKIYLTDFDETAYNLAPGTLVSDNKKYLHFACKTGYLSVLEAKPEGKKILKIREILNGIDVV